MYDSIWDCIDDSYYDYFDNELFLTKEEKEWFQILVQKIQTITKTSGRIVNGNLEKLSFGKAKEALGCNLNKGELIIIDNFDIMMAYRYKACRCQLPPLTLTSFAKKWGLVTIR